MRVIEYQDGDDLFLRINGADMGKITPNADGSFDLPGNLGDGMYEIEVSVGNRSMDLHLDIDSGRTLDPMSLRFTGPNGLVVMPDPGFFMRNGGSFSTLKLLTSGEYDLSVASCPNADVRSVGFVVDGPYTRANANSDDCEPRGSDACGPWSAKVNVPATIQAASANSAAGEVPFSIIVTTDDTQEIIDSTMEVAAAGIVRDAATNKPLEKAVVTLLQSLGDSLNAVFAAWDGSSLGQSNPQTTAGDGLYTFTGPEGNLRLSVTRSGYQPYTTEEFASDGSLIGRDIALSPEVAKATTHVVEMTENGFEPGVLWVKPGSVVEFVNVDLVDHRAEGSSWTSGLLATGASYKVELNAEGTFDYDDGANSSATIIVSKLAPEPGGGGSFGDDQAIFLPIVLK